ncbi:hypothetical protein SteCoe_19154 [Stentor coeruleus]|uniref:Uncharacterized protein n=1 Tax=Stentor coeruleus TaxID=5963 RepID=A0A1R2BUT4_9CILI|nr:hypothetical protein SteCoe_19154 [Stentor coeruleus]
MSYAKEKLDNKDQKNREKSKKSVKNRYNSAFPTNKTEQQKEFYSHQSHSSLSQVSESIQDCVMIEKYLSKIKELTEEKQQLLDVVQSNEKEFDFLNHVISQFIDLNELLRIKQKSSFDELSKVWTVPAFIVQQRKTVFPKLQRTQLKEAVENEIKQRKIKFKQQSVGNTENINEMINTKRKNKNTEGQNEKEYVKNYMVKYGEIDSRPITSITKYRQSSMFNRGYEINEDARKSPILKKYTNKIVT